MPLPLRAAAAALALAPWLLGCSGGSASHPPAPLSPPAAAPGTDAASRLPLRGTLAIEGGRYEFTECGAPASSAMAVSDGNGLLASLGEAAPKPGAPVYAEVRGGVSKDGKSIAVTELVRARPPKGETACEPPVFAGDYVASGNEPFWSVEIRENGIVFRSSDEPKGRTYPYALTRTETGAAIYATKITSPRVSTLEVDLEPARCVDTMSGEIRAFNAHVTLDGKKLEGCAAAGVPPGEFGDDPLDELGRFAGTNPDAATFWSSPLLKPRLTALLGPKLKTFVDNLQVRSPLMKDKGVFYVTGNRMNRGGQDVAAFVADPDSDTIDVVLVVDGKREEFKEGGRDVEMPADVAKLLSDVPAR